VEPSRDLSVAIARANEIREREAVRAVGWVALGVAAFCWLFGGVFLAGFLASLRLAETKDGNAVGAQGDATFVAVFGVCAMIGCAFAIWALRMSQGPIRHAAAALILNGLFLIAAVIHIVRWL
jgi:hypothetical protein